MTSDFSKPIRCFIAIDIPEAVKAHIAELQGALRQYGARISWARSEGIHLTLKFLGDVRQDLIPGISKALESVTVSTEAFIVSAKGVGCFPNSRRPRVLWVGLDGGNDLIQLQQVVETALVPLGFKREKRKFNPHLTLGRIKGPQGVDNVVQEMERLGFPKQEFPASEIRLMQSDLQPSGAVYSVLKAMSLLPPRS